MTAKEVTIAPINAVTPTEFPPRNPPTPSMIANVVWLIRLPRVLLALAVGMALSVCGVVMQAIVQNTLEDPYVLGISSGASLGATLAIMLGVGGFLGGNSVGVTAFIGAMVTSFAVIAIANMGGKAEHTALTAIPARISLAK